MKVNKIINLSDDIKLSLVVKDICIEVLILGKSVIGIEVLNKESKLVFFCEILRSFVFIKSELLFIVVFGFDILGDLIVMDIWKMLYGFIVGVMGLGKSVCINVILMSILYKVKLYEVKLMLIDLKMVEFVLYNFVLYFVVFVIMDVKVVIVVLKWVVEEMECCYELFVYVGVCDLICYNMIVSEWEILGEILFYIVIVIDELVDLMMVVFGDVEEVICCIV